MFIPRILLITLVLLPNTIEGIEDHESVISTQAPWVTCDVNSSFDFFYYQGYCYSVRFKYPISWHRAKRYCEDEGANLVSIHSDGEIGFLLRMLNEKGQILGNRVWIGLNYLNGETFTWTDGSPTDFTKWNEGEPNNAQNKEKCVSIYVDSGVWNDDECNNGMNFICKRPSKDSTVTPATPDPLFGNRENGWYAHRIEEHESVISTPAPWVACDGYNFYYYQEYCYRIINIQYSWRDAKKYCEDEGSSLVSVHSDDEIGFLLRMLSDRSISYSWIGGESGRVWIGLNYLNDEVFMWTDWSPTDFTKWNEGEPNNNRYKEKCVSMNVGNGRWNDDKCDDVLNFICKRPSKDSTVTPSTPDPLFGNCEDYWYAHHDRCYYPFGNKRFNWTEASKYCKKIGAELTSVRNSEEQAFVTYLMQLMKGDTWIAFHRTIESDKYYSLDGSDMQYTNWASGEPLSLGIQEKCVKMVYKSLNTGEWDEVECNENLHFICHKKKDPYLPKLDDSYEYFKCASFTKGWLLHDQMCFKVLEETHWTWELAEATCRDEKAHLISITSTEVLAIANYLGTKVNNTFWIGLQYNVENQTMSWVNDWPVVISKWGKNQPGPFDKNMCYASIDGYWERLPCNEEIPYICQITHVKPPAEEEPKGECPRTSDEWVPTDGSFCLLPTMTRVDWSSAFLKCLNYDSQMISLHSFKDLKTLKAILNEDVPSVFLGLGKNIKGGFIWSDGSPVDYVNWDVDEPKNEEDSCVEMSMDTLKWRVIPCSEKRHSVCMIKKEIYLNEEELPASQVNNETGSATTAEQPDRLLCEIALHSTSGNATRITQDVILKNENEEHKLRMQLLQTQMEQMDKKFNMEMKLMAEKHTAEMDQMKRLHKAKMKQLKKNSNF